MASPPGPTRSGGRDLSDPAPQGARAGAAPQDLVTRGKRPAVRAREPEPVEESHLTPRGVVLEGGPGVIDDVVVEELHVARLESRREGELLGQGHEQLD